MKIIIDIAFYQILHIPLIVLFFSFFSIYLTLYNKFFHIKNIKNVAAFLKNGDRKEQSSFGVLISCIGTVLGIGNIIGGGMSVKIAGPGVLFWILIACIFTSSLKFFETMTCLEYKKTHKTEGNISYFCIKSSFGKIGIALSLIYILCFTFGYFINGLLQVNQIFTILNFTAIYKYLAAFCISVFIFIVLKNGILSLSKFMTKVVPLMMFLYILICIYSILNSQNGFFTTFFIIINDALNPKSAGIGFMIGYAIRRLCFAADIGTGLSGTMSSDIKNDPKKQGVISVFEIIFVGISVFITGFTVVASGIDMSNLSGVSIMQAAICQTNIIKITFSIIIFLFGITTACSCGFLAQQGVKVFNVKYLPIVILVVYAILTFFSHCIAFEPILNTLDSCLILAAVINIVAIFKHKRFFYYLTNKTK